MSKRLSVNIPEEFMQRLKIEAVRRNITLTKYILMIIYKELKQVENLEKKEKK